MINKSYDKYISFDVYEYDFESCFSNFLKNIKYKDHIHDIEEKQKRNIQIGLSQKENKLLFNYLNNNSQNLLDGYLSLNNINDNNIIWTQRDGFITDTKLNNIHLFQNLKYRKFIHSSIITMDKKSLMLISDKVYVKNITNKTHDLSFYDLFKNLNFTNKHDLVNCLNKIKHDFFHIDKIGWFAIERDGKFIIPLKTGEYLNINKSSLRMIDIEDVDKKIIWDGLVYPFIQTLLVFVNGKIK